MKIENAVVLVTGANRGLGLEFAKQALARGAKKVYAAARDISTVTLEGVVPVKLDVTKPENAQALAKALGDVTVVINNAGIARVGGFLNQDAQDLLREQLQTNVFGILNVSQAFSPVLAANGGGAILNVLSALSWINTPMLGSYGVSKSAAWGLTNGLRHELRGQGTQVVGKRYRCIESISCFNTIENARETMIQKYKELLSTDQKIFPQGDSRGEKVDIFEPLYAPEKLNKNFEIVRTSKGHSSAKGIIAEAMHHYVDVDGNFIEQFQTTGFDSRLWELYLFSYLTEEGLLLDRTHNAPDFLVTNGKQTVAIEAVTVQGSQGCGEEGIDIGDLTPERIRELQRHYMPIKFGSPLYSKLKKKYWEKEHVKKRPLVFAIADFHAKQPAFGNDR